MSQLPTPTTTAPTTPVAPVPAPTGPRERRVRFGHLTLAIALIVVGALSTTTLVTLVSAEGEYLAISQDVSYGARITEADLMVVRISSPPGLDPVPADQLQRVVGNFAAVPLPAGTLLIPPHVTAERHPGQGEARIGVTLRPDRLPATPLRPGHVLLLIETKGPGGGGTGEPGGAGQRTWRAVVAEVSGAHSGNSLLGGGRRDTTLDLIVPTRDAPTIAGLAADNRLTVAVLPEQPEA